MSHYHPWGPPQPVVAQNSVSGAALAAVSPAAAAYRMSGLGRTVTVTTPDSPLLGALVLGVTCVLSWYAGAAMAPSPAAKRNWGLIGIPVGVFTGPWGLGVMGIVSMRK
jgi:hypothetical protein